MPFDPLKTLRVRWSKREKDLLYQYPDRKADGHLMHCWLTRELGNGKTVLDELEARGYDVKTFRFSIRKASK